MAGSTACIRVQSSLHFGQLENWAGACGQERCGGQSLPQRPAHKNVFVASARQVQPVARLQDNCTRVSERRKSRSVVVRAAETKEASTQELPQKQSEVEGKVPAKKEPEAAKEKPKAPTLKKGMIVRVDKDLYYDSVEALATNHPRNYKGIDYIFEDRGEVLDVRIFEAGEYALVAWAGIVTAPAWLPASMLIKVEKNTYKRIYGP